MQRTIRPGELSFPSIQQVSRSWRELAFDGQLWKNVDLHQAVGHIPPSALLALLAKNQGGYIRNLSLHGWNHLPPRALTFALTDVGGAHRSTVTTRLQRLDLQGCASLEPHAVSSIIQHSPDLTWISLRGLPFVSGDILQRIADLAKQLQHLDLSRCWRVSLLDEGIFDENNSWPVLKSLKIGGGIAQTGILECLARAAPDLECLDVSHSSEIDDDDVKDLVSVPIDMYQEALSRRKSGLQHTSSREDNITGMDPRIVTLTPSQANQLGSGFPCNGMIPRRVTKLRHINISHCPNVTQKAAAYLAYAVPHLEILEMANVGEMSSDGIVALLATTPHIKKVDLEGATQACDRVLAALTFANRKHSVLDQPLPGKELEALSLSHASNITTDGALKLLRACPNLVQLNLEVSASYITGFAFDDRAFTITAGYSGNGHTCQGLHPQKTTQLMSPRDGLPRCQQECHRSLRKCNQISFRLARISSSPYGVFRYSGRAARQSQSEAGRVRRRTCRTEFLGVVQGRT